MSPGPVLKRREHEKGSRQGFLFLSLSLHLHRNGGLVFVPPKVKPMTHYKVVPYDIPYIVAKFQPNRAEVDYPIGLVPCHLVAS